MTLLAFFEDVYRPRKLFGRSSHTSRLIRYSIDSFGKTLGHQPTLDDLTDDNVVKHMQRVVDEGKSPSTANKDRAQMLALWRFAVLTGLKQGLPHVPQLNAPQRVPMAWTKDEIGRLLAATRSLRGAIGTVPAKVWWTTLVLVCLDTGERIGAISAARWDWISGDWIVVPAEVRKGSRRDKTYRLGAGSIDALATLRKYGHADCVFHWPHSPEYLWTRYRKILKGAGLPHGRRDSFHRLRRTTASIVHAAGMDAQEALDHADRRTTQAYLDPRFKREKQACDVLAEFLERPATNKLVPLQHNLRRRG